MLTKTSLDSEKMSVTGEELDDVFVTNLDSDHASISADKGRSATHSSSSSSSPAKLATTTAATNKKSSSTALAASINEEWRRLQAGEPLALTTQADGAGAAASCGVAVVPPATVVTAQPVRRTTQAVDVFLQPSQVEEMLGQNSLLLGLPQEGRRGVGADENPQVKSSSSAGSHSLQQHHSPLPIATPLVTAERHDRPSIWQDFMSCFSLGGAFGKKKKKKRPPAKTEDDEIPFEDIRELDFIGSGAQGAVFVGEYLREKVAVKKVKDVSYCQEARHLRKLQHPNIVKFR